MHFSSFIYGVSFSMLTLSLILAAPLMLAAVTSAHAKPAGDSFTDVVGPF